MSPPAAIEQTYPFIGRNVAQRVVITFAALAPLVATGIGIALLFGRYVSWLDLGILVGFHIIGGLGISLGYHRYVAHGAFKARNPAKVLLVWAGVQALQGGPASWAATHRRHHALSDQEGDPHSPLDGLWHAHFGWIWKGNLVHNGPAFDRLMRDPVIRFFEKTQGLWYILTFVMPGFVAAGIVAMGWFPGTVMMAFWQGVLWGGFVRVFLMHHITWSINSICHTWGTRPYESPDVARNNAIFGLLGYGEGWHNNHHAFPNSAYLGHRWYQFDLGKYVLWILRPLGLVHSLVVPSRDERRRRTRSA